VKTEPAVKVLVVDDSAVVRQTMTMLLNQVGGFSVEVASDPLIAEQKIAKTRPDVIVLDLEMPRMDGLTFLENLVTTDPLPVLICSSLAARGSENAIRALELGAVGIIEKPKMGVKGFLADNAVQIGDAVRGAARARIARRKRLQELAAAQNKHVPKHALRETTDKVVAIGASTGGTEAIHRILLDMPLDCPGLVIVQHMPEGFTAAYAKRMNETCAIDVKEAADGDRILEGRALVAPGNRHLSVRRSGGHYLVSLDDGPLVSRHRPSVNVLFRTMAAATGVNGLGILLTGMGDDGADGLLEMRQAGADTIAQDEATSVVYGMPKEAVKRGAAARQLPLGNMAGAIVTFGRTARR
jgi:two-component system chemotaxis response regulator CheB